MSAPDRITLDRFTVPCILGILESEQRAPQRVEVQISMGLDVEACGDSGNLELTVDYAAVQQQVITLLQAGQWRLLESMAMAIARLLLAPPAPSERRAQIHDVEISLAKPDILDGAVPALTVRREEDWCDLDTGMRPPKTWFDVLCQTPITGAYRAHVEGGSSYSVPPTAFVHVIAGSGSADGTPVMQGQRLAMGQCRELTATGEQPLTVLLVSRPPLEG